VRDGERLAARSPYGVTWTVRDQRRGPVLRVAPLSVNGLLRGRCSASGP
jgi:hypothetical protein